MKLIFKADLFGLCDSQAFIASAAKVYSYLVTVGLEAPGITILESLNDNLPIVFSFDPGQIIPDRLIQIFAESVNHLSSFLPMRYVADF